MISKKNSLEEVISHVPQHSRIFVHGAAATPNILLAEIVRQEARLKESTLIHLHTEGPALYAMPEHRDYFKVVNLFVGHNMRKALDYNRVDYLPCFLSEIPRLFKSRQCPLDVALLHVSPPDRFGYCSLGVSVDIAKAAAESAKILIAQINPYMPRIHGDGLIHISKFKAFVEVSDKLPERIPCKVTSEEKAIAQNVASLVENGSTLQMGIGSIPDAIAYELHNHKELGIHTEMWSDGTLSLIEKGVVTNEHKKVHRGKSVSGFMIGSQRLYDFVNDNPAILQLEIDYVNNPRTIARNPKAVAINSAIEIDLSGQVCADSIGHQIVSGVGGQMDFMRGATLSEGGKAIIAFSSQTKHGVSKIVSSLKQGAGVVTTRSHIHYVVTEFGIAHLYGKTLGERARALIAIAHPKHRESLEKEFVDNKKSAKI